MGNLTITNNDRGSPVFKAGRFEDDTLNLSGAQAVVAGQILARDSVSLKLVNFVPGGAAIKSTGDGPFNLDPGDTAVLDVNDVGNATATFDASPATITDTTTYAVADQDGLTSIVTLTGGPYSGVAQTVLFAGATTTAAGVAAQMNDQLEGCSVAVVGGQVKITHDGAGAGMAIAVAAGTGALTWAAAVDGDGDVVDIDATTATEVKTVVENDTNATVTVVGDAAVIKATSELDFISGLALAKLGLSVETITANENGDPKAVMSYGFTGANGDNAVRAGISGEVITERLVIADGSSITAAIRDQLRNYGLVPVSVTELSELDNQ